MAGLELIPPFSNFSEGNVPAGSCPHQQITPQDLQALGWIGLDFKDPSLEQALEAPPLVLRRHTTPVAAPAPSSCGMPHSCSIPPSNTMGQHERLSTYIPESPHNCAQAADAHLAKPSVDPSCLGSRPPKQPRLIGHTVTPLCPWEQPTSAWPSQSTQRRPFASASSVPVLMPHPSTGRQDAPSAGPPVSSCFPQAAAGAACAVVHQQLERTEKVATGADASSSEDLTGLSPFSERKYEFCELSRTLFSLWPRWELLPCSSDDQPYLYILYHI